MRITAPNSPTARANASATPESSAGSRCGKTTRRKIATRPAPSDAAASLGAGRVAIFRRVVFPHLLPALLSGVALAFARAVGEFGAVILISGNLPFKTEVASLYVFQRINSGDTTGASALAVLLLSISLVVLLLIGAIRRWATRHDR